MFLQRESTVRNITLYKPVIGFVFNLSASSFGDVCHFSSWFSKSALSEERMIFAKADVRSLFRSLVSLSVDTAYWHGLVSLEYTITNLLQLKKQIKS